MAPNHVATACITKPVRSAFRSRALDVAEIADCVFKEPSSRKADSVTLGLVTLSVSGGRSSNGYRSYITALEERCAQLESALLQADPTHEAVQDHLAPTAISGGQSRLPLSESLRIASTTLPSRITSRTHRGSKFPAEDQNEEELESTIRDYLEDLSAKAAAETPYVGELSGLTFAKLAKA